MQARSVLSVQNRVFTLLSISTLFIVVFIYFNVVSQSDFISPDLIKRSQKSIQSGFETIFLGNTEKAAKDERKNELTTNKTLFCLIKTTPNALKSNKTLTVFNIWASRCSNYRFVTIIPEELRPSAEIYGEHREIQMPFYLLHPEGLKVVKYYTLFFRSSDLDTKLTFKSLRIFCPPT